MTHPRCVGWGEMGLDYHYDNSPRDLQQEVFRRQLRQAVRLRKPLTIHTREAEEDTEKILKEEVPQDHRVSYIFCATAVIRGVNLSDGSHWDLVDRYTYTAIQIRRNLRSGSWIISPASMSELQVCLASSLLGTSSNISHTKRLTERRCHNLLHEPQYCHPCPPTNRSKLQSAPHTRNRCALHDPR